MHQRSYTFYQLVSRKTSYSLSPSKVYSAVCDFCACYIWCDLCNSRPTSSLGSVYRQAWDGTSNCYTTYNSIHQSLDPGTFIDLNIPCEWICIDHAFTNPDVLISTIIRMMYSWL